MGKTVLAGDIGGTKTTLALFSVSDPNSPLLQRTFSSSLYPAFDQLLKPFMEESGSKPDAAVMAVAGPVIGGKARITNLPWEIGEAPLAEKLGGIPVRLINDLEALALAVPRLGRSDLHVLHEGFPAGGIKAVIAPGTGLGEAFIADSGNGFVAFPSEGGHADFAPVTDLEIDLLLYMKRKHAHVSCERVCSGLGIVNLFHFLVECGHAGLSDDLRGELKGADDPVPIIVRYALEKNDELCRRTLDLFLSILGGEAGNLVLKVLALDGLYLGGGLPPRLLPLFSSPAFLESFRNKGRFSELMNRVPVQVIIHANAGLFGAAVTALGELGIS